MLKYDCQMFKSKIPMLVHFQEKGKEIVPNKTV